MNKTIGLIISLIIALGLSFYIFLYPKLEIVAGYNAKLLCSCLFVADIDQETAEAVELGFGPLWLASNTIDLSKKTVSSNVLGMHPKKAVYRAGLGCALVNELDPDEVGTHQLSIADINYGEEIWNHGIINGTPEMQAALKNSFDTDGSNKKQTRAVVVVKNGRIIGEAYAPGFDQNSRLLGWSMAKSVTATLAGILLKDGYWSLDAPMGLEAWQGDERRNITLRNVLQMSPGLDWTEDYGSVSTATVMLYGSDAMGAFALSKSLIEEPGSAWVYSSGTSNILAMSLAGAFPDRRSYWEFPYQRLFGPLGIKSFVIETDASGHFVGSSYGYASARDWAKLGLLYLNEGNWFGQQIVDKTWVDFVRQPVKDSDGTYGGHFWLNADGGRPHYDSTSYWMGGFQGQEVSIHPQDSLVVVRMGVTYEKGDFDFDGWMEEIKKAALVGLQK